MNKYTGFNFRLLRVEHSPFHEGRPVVYLALNIPGSESNPYNVIREVA
jgi:hypothetical protein